MTLKNFLVLVLGAIFLVSCSEEEAMKKMPNATQQGKNTLGAYVNGDLFAVKNIGENPLREGVEDTWSINNNVKEYSFRVNPTIYYKDESSRTITIGIAEKLIEGKTYVFDGENVYANYNHSWVDKCVKLEGGEGCSYAGTGFDAKTGYIKITKRKVGEPLTNPKGFYSVIISGLFEFSGVDEKGKEIKVTDGRFDVTATTNYID
ncbi:hypothetical protein ACQ1Q5_00240 [Ornithobacterium rhinotracheale]